jgi:Flp pilus assembly pilin Flp
VLKKLKELLADDRGTQVVEYGLLLVLVALVALAGIAAFGTSVKNLFVPLTGTV